MSTTPNIDDELLAGIKGKTALVRTSLQALFKRESSRDLACLGRSEP